MPLHKSQTAGKIHLPYAWTYANATARTSATGFVSADIGKWARQLSDNTMWMLTGISPRTWVSIWGVHNNSVHTTQFLTTGTWRSDANLDIMLGGPTSNADTLHTHAWRDLSKAYRFYDFFGTSALPPEISNESTGSGTVVMIPARGGQLKLSTGTTSSSYARAEFKASTILQFSKNYDLDLTVRAKLSAVTSVQARIGFFGASNKGIYFFADSGQTNWRCYSRTVSLTNTDSGVALDTAWHKFRILTSTSNAKFYIDGNLVATITTNLPATGMSGHFLVWNSTTSSRELYLDWMEFLQTRQNPSVPDPIM